jgi:GR25 family glycosyltransferase involved in LPS biosynthesis
MASASNSKIDDQNVPKIENIPIYVCALASEKRRKKYLTKRLVYHDLLKNTKFITAVTRVSNEVSKVLEGRLSGKESPEMLRLYQSEAACHLSHLTALLNFVLVYKDPHDKAGALRYALILESDSVPHNEFKKLANEVIEQTQKVAPAAPLIQLGPYFSDRSDVKVLSPTLGTIGEKTYGTHAYLISLDYAQKLVSNMIRGQRVAKDGSLIIDFLPFKEYKEEFCLLNDAGKRSRVTSELITIRSGGVTVFTPLVIDESIDTSIQGQHSNDWHLRYYGQFNHKNYVNADLHANNELVLQRWGITAGK